MKASSGVLALALVVGLSVTLVAGWSAPAAEAAATAGTGGAPAKPEAEPFETPEGFLLNIKDADVAVLLELYSRLTGKAILPGAQITGKVNVINRSRVPKEQAIAIVESVLELNGFATVVGDRVIKVVPKRDAVKRDIATRFDRSGTDPRSTDRIETHLVVLKYAKAESAKGIVTPLLSEVGTIATDKDTNTLVITEVASNSARLVRILRELDVPPPRFRSLLRSYPVRFAPVEDVGKQVGEYFKSREKREGEPDPVFSPDRRMGTLMVTAVAGVHEEMPEVLRVFDKRSPDARQENLVIRLEYAKAASVAAVLTKLVEKDTGKPDEKKVSIVADEATNTLIVSAEPGRFPVIQDLVRTLDQRNKQVLVKAIIMEVTLRSGSSLGVGWQYDQGQNKFQSNVGSPISSSTPFTAAQNALQGLKYAFFDPGKFTAFLNAVVTGASVNILSAPHILTINNKPAEIVVGQEVPYTKDSRVSDNQAVIKTNEYRKVGVKLKVTPQVTESNEVIMDIEEEISGLQGTNPDLDAPIFFTREAKCSVIVRSDHTVVIGGLIKRDVSKTKKKVPFLGDLPFIKYAFRYEDSSTEKTELIAFITPIVLDTNDRADQVRDLLHDDFNSHITDKRFRRDIDGLFQRVARDTVPLDRPGRREAALGDATEVRLLDPLDAEALRRAPPVRRARPPAPDPRAPLPGPAGVPVDPPGEPEAAARPAPGVQSMSASDLAPAPVGALRPSRAADLPARVRTVFQDSRGGSGS